MIKTPIVVASESGHCRSFRHWDDAHEFADQLIAEDDPVLLTVADPSSGRYLLYAMVPIDYEDDIRGWDRACPERDISRWEHPDGTPYDRCIWRRTIRDAIHHISVIVRPGLGRSMRDFHPREHGGYEGMARAAAAYAVGQNLRGLPTLIVTHHRLGGTWSLQTCGK